MTLPIDPTQLPSQAELRALLDYDPDTGVLTWRIATSPRARAGAVAGTTQSCGYRQIGVNGRRILAHRIAWAISIGEWPASQIDHINGIRDDNRILNLREATPGQNNQNQRRAKSHSKSGFLGVYFRADRGQWQADIRIDGKNKYLGRFATAELAHSAYLAAKADLHPFQTITKD